MDPQSKAEKMRKKTADMRRMFNLPDTEDVVQDYACAYKGRIQGRMYVSQNYLSFCASLSETQECIPYRKITEISKDYTLVFNNAITITTQSGQFFFGSFVHRDETFNLLFYLWKNPPSYVEVYDSAPSGSSSSYNNSLPQPPPPPSSSDPFKSTSSGDGFYLSGTQSSTRTDSQAPIKGGSYGQQQETLTKVDTETSRNALRIVAETREIGAATMSELSYQAEVIDLIERDVENVHNNLDKADRLVRGMESVGGTIANAFSGQKKGKELGYVDRTLNFTREDAPVDIEILRKLPNDNLLPGILRFASDKFMCLNSVTKKPEKESIFVYENVESIVIRARHLHLDVRFKDKTSRYRLFSSYIQAVVNEIVLRTRGKSCEAQVLFEPGTKKFAYGSSSITIPTAPTNGERKVALFRKDVTPQVSPLIKNAPEDVRQGLIQQEEDLDQISNILGDLHGMATTMGTEITRQTEQLGVITKRVDQAGERMHRTNQRIDRIG